MSLAAYRPLGRSGLIVSPLALGTMTFGTERWGSDAAGSRAIFDAYVDAGGNFIDTADVYSGGRSEDMLGQFIADRGVRDRIVLATKSGWSTKSGNPHAGGNGAKAIRAALDRSLARLRTDYVDLFWVHVWDQITPFEELLATLGDLVRAGKIRYFGLSNVPAWVAAAMAARAAATGVPGPIALQFEYSLVERGIEAEHLPVGRAFGMGMTPWSPLAAGFLAGKYRREAKATDGRLSGSNPFGDSKFTEHNWRVLDALLAVAEAVGRPPAQVALAWVAARTGVAAPIIGVSRPDQLADSIAALDLTLDAAHRDALDAAGAGGVSGLSMLFTPAIRRTVFGGATVTGG